MLSYHIKINVEVNVQNLSPVRFSTYSTTKSKVYNVDLRPLRQNIELDHINSMSNNLLRLVETPPTMKVTGLIGLQKATGDRRESRAKLEFRIKVSRCIWGSEHNLDVWVCLWQIYLLITGSLFFNLSLRFRTFRESNNPHYISIFLSNCLILVLGWFWFSVL